MSAQPGPHTVRNAPIRVAAKQQGKDPRGASAATWAAVCTVCGEYSLVAQDVERVSCVRCSFPIWRRPCQACGELNTVSATATKWLCHACHQANSESVIRNVFGIMGGTLFAEDGPSQVQCAYLSGGILTTSASIGYLYRYWFFPWWEIVSIDFEGETEYRARLSATRMLALGVFSLAAPKRTTVRTTYVTLGLLDGSERTLKLAIAPQDARARFGSALNEWEKWRPPPREWSGEPAPSDAPDPIDQLRKLAELHRAGVLSDEEFQAKKQVLLDRIQ